MYHAFDTAVLRAAVRGGPVVADAGLVQGDVEVEALKGTSTVAADVLDVGGGGGETVGKADEDGGEFGFGFAGEGPCPVGGIVNDDEEVALAVWTYGAGVTPCVDIEARAELHVAGGFVWTEW